MKNNVINVCLTFDKNYLGFASVLLHSISKTLKQGYFVNVTVLTSCKYLIASGSFHLDKYSNISIVFIDVSHDLQLLPGNTRFPKEVFSRLLMPHYLKGKMLYLDVDIVVLRCLSLLYEIPFDEGYSIAAVPDDGHALDKLLARYPDFPFPYFNAGVLLVDLDCNETQQIFSSALKLAHTRTFRLADQDSLNFVVKGKFQVLKSMFNNTSLIAKNDVVIYHFAHLKPNRALAIFRMHRMFFNILSLLNCRVPDNPLSFFGLLKKVVFLSILQLLKIRF